MIYSITNSNKDQSINGDATQTKIREMMYEQNGTITNKLLEYNNFKVKEHDNSIEIVNKVYECHMIDSTKQKEESLTLSTYYLKPLNQ